MSNSFSNIDHVSRVAKEEIAAIAKMNVAEIDENFTLEDYFFDSIKMAQLAESMGSKLQLEVNIADLYNAGNIKNTILHLTQMLQTDV